MTTREDLLATIAAAQAQLAGLNVIPEEDPGGEVERYFRLIARHGSSHSHYAYLLLRLPSADWYVTGTFGRGGLADRNGRMSWQSVRTIIERLTVVSWDELIVEDATTVAQATKLVDEINTARDALQRAGYPGVSLSDQVRKIISYVATDEK